MFSHRHLQCISACRKGPLHRGRREAQRKSDDFGTPVRHVNSGLQSYRYLSMLRKFCPKCGIQMTITFADQDHALTGNVSVNVRTFLDAEYEKIKVLYVDMKDEEPLYDPDKAL